MVLLDSQNHEHNHNQEPKHNHDHVSRGKDLLTEAYNLLKENKPISATHGNHSTSGFTSVREIDYMDHHIKIKTRYEIEIDGKTVNSQIYVDNEGKVSSHALPAYSFPSAVDLIKRIIDKFPIGISTSTSKGGIN